MENRFYIDSTLDDFNEDDLNEVLNDDRYNNYLTSWLDFNKRVLNEARRSCNPIVERLNFVGIADSNLDEFIRTKFKDNKGIKKDIHSTTIEIETVYDELLEELKSKYSIAILHPADLRNDSIAYTKLKKVFKNKVYPLIQPLLLTDELPMPDIDDGGLFLVSRIEKMNCSISGIIKLPDTELIEIDVKNSQYKHIYCINSEIIEEFVPLFYKGSKIIWNKMFRVYRKVDSLSGNRNNNYISSIKNQLVQRKNAKVMLVDVVENINGIETVVGSSKKRYRKYPYGLSYLKNIKDYIDYKSDMVYDKSRPRIPISLMGESIFDTISASDRLIHFPYEDFKLSTIRLLEEAAIDPDVKSIRQTLYRVSKESRLIKALITAAKNGKQVVVLLELKAKMDEQHNIELIERLRSAGCNLIFGPIEMKTHAKVTLIVREEDGKLEQYCNISTGNFNESTAKAYEDFSYFCKNRAKFQVGKDLLDLFNFLGGCSTLDKSNELLISPFTFRSEIEKEINDCIEYKTNNPTENVEITIKCNSFTDKKIADKLYNASEVGVNVRCIIRGMNILKPGVKGLSENISVISIVGRYLEHSRIYQFIRGENSKTTYIGSGDIMPRNLDRRIEVIIPIKNKNIKDKISDILNKYFEDNTNSYKLINDTYSLPVYNEITNVISADNKPFSIQNYFIDEYKKLEKSSVK